MQYSVLLVQVVATQVTEKIKKKDYVIRIYWYKPTEVSRGWTETFSWFMFVVTKSSRENGLNRGKKTECPQYKNYF